MNARWLTGMFVAFLVLLGCAGGVGASSAVAASSSSALIITHNNIDITQIPDEWIEKAKELAFQVAHTSHGSQILTGLEWWATQDSRYAVNVRYDVAPPPPAGALQIYDGNNYTGDNYITPEMYWASADGLSHTRGVADTGYFDFSTWSWCGQQSDNSDETVDGYLSAVDQLESTHPTMRFIMMTGHTDGGSDTLARNNQRVRNYATSNGKLLFDFADFEQYDPAGNYYPDASDSCPWCVQWCTDHPEDCAGLPDPDTNPDWCAHTHPLQCKLKSAAFWWMAARLAGWPGPTPEAASPQPTGVAATYRSGQTFITWQERGELPNASYRVYRHDNPITALNLADATFLYEAPVGSARFYSNRYNVDGGGVWANRYLERLVTDTASGELAAGTGLLVWTLRTQDFSGAQNGSGYYAVTTVEGGVENRSDFTSSNSIGPVEEHVADPLPVAVNGVGAPATGHVYIQYMDLRTWNPTFHAPNPLNGFYGLTETDPGVADAIQYAYDYTVFQPTTADCGGSYPEKIPVMVSLHGWGDNAYPPHTGIPDDFGWCIYRVYPIDTNQTWWFGFAEHQDYRTGNPPGAGDTIANYTEQRVLRMVYDLLRDPPGPPADANRVFIYGSSMGGSGTLAFALRYPAVFAAAYASEPMTNYATSSEWIGDVTPKWGDVAANLPVSITAPNGWGEHLQPYEGEGVFDWQNHQANVAARGADETVPLGIGHGTLDNVIAWDTQGQPTYPAFNVGRRMWGGVTVETDHHWLGFAGLPYNLASDNSLTPFAGFQVVRDESVPGLNNSSADAPLPPVGAGGYNQTIRWSSSWDAWDGAPVDTLSRWQISLCSKDPDFYVTDCGSGPDQVVDITPRRLQHFAVTPLAGYKWENRRVRDNGLVASGRVTADAAGLVTVPAFALTEPEGNRLVLEPDGGPPPPSSELYLPQLHREGSDDARKWPVTSSGISVFNDQLASNLSDAQWRFAATHYAGTQKMLRQDADKLRSYNPNFLILHYRLGIGLGYRSISGSCEPNGDYLQIIEGNQWVQEWPGAAAVQERWFYHWPVSGSVRVLNCDWGWYLMEPNDTAYRAYWQAEVLRQMQANDADGLFLDSLSIPNYLGADRYDPPLPAVDAVFESGWASRIANWLAWMQSQPIGKYTILPNAGAWITSRDATNYGAADGVMIEGFALWGSGDYFSEDDWRLQMNRVLQMVAGDKIVIAQSYGSDVAERLFATASYLLIRGRHTYLNLDTGLEPEWWPEYDVKLLAAQTSAGDDIDELRTGNGAYVRRFEGGLVAVNPADSGPALTVDLGTGSHWLVEPAGGGEVPASGAPTGHLTFSPITSLEVGPQSAAIVVTSLP